ncbi:MAG: GNAT family N-acetyltransferase [Planctomycetes bacterium]|nr:GNAT family N-acetyltransferase [Planctomycetota bacterium]
MKIRRATEADFDGMWPIFQAVVAAGDTMVLAPDTSKQVAHDYWFAPGITTYVASDHHEILGMYKFMANQPDLGSHVANASFMVDPAAQGMGVGKAMGEHCLAEAKDAGFLAMQFNFVVSTNTGAVKLWKQLGFSIVGTLPKAFQHAKLGHVDAFVMHRHLQDNAMRGSA